MQPASSKSTGPTSTENETSESADGTTCSRSTSSAADSPAKIFPTPDSGQVLMENAAGCFSKPSDAFARFSHDLWFSRTWQHLSQVEQSTDCSLIDAYAAGLIDGEGCISLSKHSNKSGCTYAVRLEVGMAIKAMDILQWLAKTFGGTIRKTRNGSDRWMEAHTWGLFGKKAVPVLQQLLPQLKLKKQQAKLALSVQHLASDGWTPQNRERGAKLWECMRELNRKGPEQQSESCSIARLAGGTWQSMQRSLFSADGWEPFSGRWPRSGLMRNGIAYRLPPLVPRISGTGYFFTPTAKANQASPSMMKHPGIRAALWPNPQARDATPRGAQAKRYTDPARSSDLPDAVAHAGSTGQLNPAWVEWLMGFPPGWTDLEDSETQ